jgi:hypothetical protein
MGVCGERPGYGQSVNEHGWRDLPGGLRPCWEEPLGWPVLDGGG